MSHATSVISNSRKSLLLGTSALVCLALAGPVMADDFVITSSDGSTNGNIDAGAIDGSDTVSLGVALTTTATDNGINTININNVDDGNTVTVTETGSIETTGVGAFGIYNGGDENITTVSGSIKTTEAGAFGIANYKFENGASLSSDRNATTVSGSIETAGDEAVGIINIGDENTTTVSDTGSITTGDVIAGTGNTAFGIYNVGDKNITTVSDTGSIETAGDDAYGIFNVGNGNETTVSGTGSIETAGDEAYGIANGGNKNITTVSGSIETAWDDAYGIWNIGVGNKTTVSGSIKTGDVVAGTGNDAYGIYNVGDDNTTTVSGSITTTGEGAYGIYNEGDNNETTVSGSITTGGVDAYGIANQGHKNITTIAGVISTKSSYGLIIGGNDNISYLEGSIQNSGTWADGIRINGNSNKTYISGTIDIVSTDQESVGVSQWGSYNQTFVSGTVRASNTVSQNYALQNFLGTGNEFILNEGAIIIGQMGAPNPRGNGASNNKFTINLGASSSYAYFVGGEGVGVEKSQWDFTDQDGRTPVVTTAGTSCANETDVTVCNLVTGVSTGNLEVQDELQFSMNSSMIGSLSLGSNNSAAPVEAMPSTQTLQNNTWVNIYGDTSDRSASTTKLAFDGSNRGLTIGTPVAISDTLNLDLVFNASNANLDIGPAKEQQITAKSYNVGAVLRDLAPSTGWAVDAFGFVGRNSYDGKRKVMNNQEATGSETVTAAYSGSEVLVGVDAQYSNPVTDTLNFIGGLNASLSNEKIGAYSESKYYSWDARTMTQATGGITAGLEYQKDALTTFASLGLQRSSLQNGKTATYTNNGTAASFTDSSTGDTRRSVTVGFDYAGSESMTFSGAVEAFTSTGGVSGNSASLTANWKF